MALPNQTRAWIDHEGTVRATHDPDEGQVWRKLVRFARKSPRKKLESVHAHLMDQDWYWTVRNRGKDRTAYVIGLFGTGRWYVTDLLLEHIGERAKFLRYEIRYRSRPTSMIYSEHATIKYTSRGQVLPAVTSRILDAVRARTADLIFVYRHPLDSLLTNWVWWRTYVRERRKVAGVSQVYANTAALCADLEANFSEFEAFARGDPTFYAALPGPRFLSFAEFVEETELYLHSATLALRLEDFSADPVREFVKLADVMSVHLDPVTLRLDLPRTKPYGHLIVKQYSAQFARYVDALDAETKRRIAAIGYP